VLFRRVTRIGQTINHASVDRVLRPPVKIHRARTHLVFYQDPSHHIFAWANVYLGPFVHVYVSDVAREVVQLPDCAFYAALNKLKSFGTLFYLACGALDGDFEWPLEGIICQQLVQATVLLVCLGVEICFGRISPANGLREADFSIHKHIRLRVPHVQIAPLFDGWKQTTVNGIRQLRIWIVLLAKSLLLLKNGADLPVELVLAR